MKYLLIILSILFISCDKCKDNFCQNDSICIDGGCECLDGYSGDLCEVELNPKHIEITKVILNSYPEFNSDGEPWDNAATTDTGYADLRLSVRDLTGISLVYFIDEEANYVADNADPNTPIIFYPTQRIFLEHDLKYALFLYDYDILTTFDLVQADVYNLYTNGQGFPISVSLDNYTVFLNYSH